MQHLGRLVPLIVSLAALSVPAAAQLQAVPPAPGDICISEVMFIPLCATQDNGEWFEVTNISGKVIDMNGLYFQDGGVPGENGPSVYFQVLPSVATLPPMLPGQRFVFARCSDPILNNYLPQIDYCYASQSAAGPVDHSQVGHSKMNLGNSNIDGMHITLGAPAALGGIVIDSVSYNPAVAPFGMNAGISCERIDLYQPMVVVGTANSPNLALALLSAGFGGCQPQESGTPGQPNSTDATATWKVYLNYYDTGSHNTGTLTSSTQLSVAAGSATFQMTNGSPYATYALGYADAPSEIPLDYIFGGNFGSILLDLNTTNYLYDPYDPAYYFDQNGSAALTVQYSVTPQLVGTPFYLQWLGVDLSQQYPFTVSNGIQMIMTP